MDTLAALAFGGESLSIHRYMCEKPKSRDEKIVSKAMWSQIFTGAAWAFILSLAFLIASPLQNMFLNNKAEAFTDYTNKVSNSSAVVMVPNPENAGGISAANDLFKFLFTGYFALFIFIAVFNAFKRKKQNSLICLTIKAETRAS
jgi:ABC-type Fe3+-siderophore transport system permease subunit